jgi:threonine dehydrogenase-like Zn-dependent dehydrogenase
VTRSAICGTDLHTVRGTLSGMEPGTILGHEAVAVFEEVGPGVRNFVKGDRVVVPSTIACGYCSYCRAGYHAQCDNAIRTVSSVAPLLAAQSLRASFHGLQAEYIRVPYANTGLVKLPEEVNDHQTIMLSDIVPKGYFGADMAAIKPNRSVAVFGCGPVGQFAIMSAKLMGAERVFAVDTVPSRLDMAQQQGAEAIDFNQDDPVKTIRELTGGIGVDRVIDAVGVDAVSPSRGRPPNRPKSSRNNSSKRLAPTRRRPIRKVISGGLAMRLRRRWSWAVQVVAKAGTVSIIGVYPPTQRTFPSVWP